VATVKQLTASRYQITMTETELVFVKNALAEAERVTRFGAEVLDDVDRSPGAEPSENSRLRREIEALAMREASLRSLQKTMAEVDPRGKPAPVQHADLDQLRSEAALQVPPSR
jgi:DNA repair exonuclease SbcCD ATPase subunit